VKLSAEDNTTARVRGNAAVQAFLRNSPSQELIHAKDSFKKKS
jgi:hypothetical protein